MPPKFDGLGRPLDRDRGRPGPGRRRDPGRLAPLRGRGRRPRRSPPTASPGPTDPLLLYFTSGTTAQPKLVEHTHASYPVGHLSTMYWLGLQPGRRAPEHLLARLGQARLELRLRALERRGHRAGPQLRARSRRDALLDAIGGVRGDHVLRAADRLADADPGGPGRGRMSALRECVARRRAAEPGGDRAGPRAPGASPSATATARPRRPPQIGNSPGQPVKPGSMGRPLPGYDVALVDPVTGERGRRGRDLPAICRPAAAGADDRLPGRRRAHAEAMRGGYYRTGDVAAATTTATSPTSAAPTTCSRPPTTGSARSSSRAC